MEHGMKNLSIFNKPGHRCIEGQQLFALVRGSLRPKSLTSEFGTRGRIIFMWINHWRCCCNDRRRRLRVKQVSKHKMEHAMTNLSEFNLRRLSHRNIRGYQVLALLGALPRTDYLTSGSETRGRVVFMGPNRGWRHCCN